MSGLDFAGNHIQLPDQFVNATTEVSSERFVTEPLSPINGFIRVPEQPGLGVALDMKEVERLAQVEPMATPKFMVVCKYDNGTTLYTRRDPENPHFMVRPDWSRMLMPMSFVAPLKTEYWDDDGSADFDAMMARVGRDGAVLEPRASQGDREGLTDGA